MEFGQLHRNKIFLVTGAAGFIGYFLAKRLLEQGCRVVGVDNLNDYYDVSLKKGAWSCCSPSSVLPLKCDISDKKRIDLVFTEHEPHIVINLAAQAGVRYSIKHPEPYISSNISGFFNILECCRRCRVEHLLFASSSSVYGNNKKVPFAESDVVDHPISLYAATKKSNELMAYTYSYLYNIPATGLRFFTVYGPLGRPDMAYFTFTDSYFAGKAIKIYNNGDYDHDLYRDFKVCRLVCRIIQGAGKNICPVTGRLLAYQSRVPNRASVTEYNAFIIHMEVIHGRPIGQH